MGNVGKVEQSKYQVVVEVKGTILGVREIQDRGRVQIPKKAREKLNIKDGDSIYWIELGDRVYISKAVKIE